MKYRFKVSFVNKQALAILLLEIFMWKAQKRKFEVQSDQEHILLTSDKNIIDIVTETLRPNEYYITDNK